jgi:hypothetical protein
MHFAVNLKSGGMAYLYIHPSDWDADEICAHIELLAIVGEARHACKRDAIWFVNLGDGVVLRPGRTYKQTRKGLDQTMKLFERINPEPSSRGDGQHV